MHKTHETSRAETREAGAEASDGGAGFPGAEASDVSKGSPDVETSDVDERPSGAGGGASEPGVTIRLFKPKEDFAAAARFAQEGMHLDNYAGGGIVGKLFAADAMCEAIARSTHFYAAYDDARFAGFLLADSWGAPKPYERSRYARFHGLAKALMQLSDRRDAENAYAEANKDMLGRLDPVPNVEITYFAADPSLVGKGVGSKLLAAFERDFIGKRAFLFTDDGCTYQFYEHRGFTRAEERTIPGAYAEGRSMRCMTYVKQL